MENKKYILVTGATGGMGAHVCRMLAAKNYAPMVGYHNAKAQAEALAAECGGTALHLDLENNDSIDAALKTLESIGTLAGITHCASPAPKLAPFGKITEEELAFFWRANVAGPHRLLAGLIKQHFKAQKSGIIVAVTSRGMGDSLTTAMPGLGAYTISKFGLYGVLALMASEYKWLNVTTVSPGFTDTKMLEAFDPRFIEQMKEIARPEDVAREIASYF